MATLKDVKRIVIKVGTSSLTHSTGKTNIRQMKRLVTVISDIVNSGIEVALVSSGAIGVGVGKLGLKERPVTTAGKQAAATVGQCELMFMYDKMFGEYGHKVGQFLVTKRDGDNDNLSAIVAKLIKADALFILTDIDGLYDANPNENEYARIIPVVEEITEGLFELAGGKGSKFGTGGMITKLQAAQIATEAGIDTVIMNGGDPENLYKILEGHQVGTFFVAKDKEQSR